MSPLRIETHTGPSLREHLPDIARLRIRVFRDWPYCYDGDAEYEQGYLQTYIDTTDAMVALCFDGTRVVGASTALPLAHETADLRAPFEQTQAPIQVSDTLYLGRSVHEAAQAPIQVSEALYLGRSVHEAAQAPIQVSDTLYLGESVLEPAYRGHGIGVAFFAEREAHARRLGLRHAVFCAVQRAADDPRRPSDYQSLDAFWQKRGYRPLTLTAPMAWREVGASAETTQTMRFWHRALA